MSEFLKNAILRRQSITTVAVVAAMLILTAESCDKSETPDSGMVNLPSAGGHALLSDYNFFSGNLADLVPNEEAGVLPYDLNTALFSDYASKKRYIYVPPGSKMSMDTTAVLDLPAGSALIKHFYYVQPDGSEDYVETRLLYKLANNEWQAETYIWNEEQTDAQRSLVGGSQQLTTVVNGQSRTFNYLIPNQNQCKNCHSDQGTLKPVGPRVQNLNKDYPYSFGSANQLATWMDRGILEQKPMDHLSSWPALDDLSVDLNTRARAYLDVNCASCHHLEGSAANSGLYLEFETSDPLHLGIWKTPVAAGAGSGGFTYVIHPGEGDQSILLYRMIALEPDERMPEIGRDLIHDEGVQLIREWINSL